MDHIAAIPPRHGIVPGIFCVSVATIGWQIALMQCLLISRYHHFSFLIISCALLGFAAGGVFLSLFQRRIEERRVSVFRWCILGFALSMPISFRIAEALPVNVYFAAGESAFAISWWLFFWAIHCTPFFLAGLIIGSALTFSDLPSHTVYATSMVGSAAGAPVSIVLLSVSSPNSLGLPFCACVLASCIPLTFQRSMRVDRVYRISVLAAMLAVAAAWYIGPDKLFPLNVDQYKTLAYTERLVQQGSAEKTATLYGPRGRVDLFSGRHFHALLSLNSQLPPPRMDIVLKNGFHVGSAPRITTISEARFLEQSLLSLPYRLTSPHKILILGEAGAILLWCARLSNADLIVLVQPDHNIVEILKNHPSRVLDDKRVQVQMMEPRAFLERTDMSFDIIHLAAMDGFAAGSAGVGGLKEDYLATIEGFTKCLEVLSPHGMTQLVRGIQDPARDNIRIPATWIEAFEKINLGQPDTRILMARDELACATLASRNAFTPETVTAFRSVCQAMSWETEWFPGVRPEDTNLTHVLPGPSGFPGSWLHHALVELFSSRREEFYRNWLCNIRPATDDRPFFYDFFRWSSLAPLSQALGPTWPTRSEMGFLLLIISAVWSAAMATILLPAPIVILKRSEGHLSTSLLVWIIVFFSALGAGFMFIEMSLIQVMTRFLGDPILAVAMVLGGVLFFAGVGSMIQPVVTSRMPGGIGGVLTLIVTFTAVDVVLFQRFFAAGVDLSSSWKIFLSTGLIGPLSLLLGIPFPWALSVLHANCRSAIPLAWAVNGFASVTSTSLAVILAMTYGFRFLWLLAATIYVIAGILSWLCVSQEYQSKT